MEVEYIGKTMVATTVIQSRNLFYKLQISKTISKNVAVIYAKNQGAIKLVEISIFNKQSKYIVIQYYYIKDFIQLGKVFLEYKKMQEMIADCLIKSLDLILFIKFMKCQSLIIETEAEQDQKIIG